MIACLIIIFLCISLILYTYLLYPILLKRITKNKPMAMQSYAPDEELPDVFILMSAYNEEKIIAQKIDSVYLTDYPISKIHFYIGSDCSSDKTNSILLECKNKYPELQLFLFNNRNGKAGVLNQLTKSLATEKPDDIIIFTDANVLFEKQTIYHLVKYFKEKAIGQVAANIINYGVDSKGIGVEEAYYIERENKIKYMEGQLNGSMIGAFGACYAIRRSLIIPFPPNILMEDFYLSMSVLERKYKAILALEAICKEDLPGLIQDEFKRKSRISAGNYQNMGYYLKMLLQPFNSVWFCYVSHKIIRWFTPFIILIILISSVFLASTSNTFLIASTCLLFFTGLLLFLDIIMEKADLHFLILRFIRYFLYMNLALLNGFFIYIKGVKTNAWTSTNRSTT